MIKIRNIEELSEEAHPFLKNVKMKTLLSQTKDQADVTCILVMCPAGSEIDEHIHLNQDDIIFVLEGKATMWIEGKGEFLLTPGTFVFVPRGMKHRTFNVKERLLVYDVFTPPLF